MSTTWKQPGEYPLHGSDFFNTHGCYQQISWAIIFSAHNVPSRGGLYADHPLSILRRPGGCVEVPRKSIRFQEVWSRHARKGWRTQSCGDEARYTRFGHDGVSRTEIQRP